MPSSANFPFLKTLALRHVLILSEDSLTASVTAFFRANGIRVDHVGAAAVRSGASWKTHAWKPVEDEVVKGALEVVLRADAHPLLICDVSGVRRVGVVVGVLRRLQWWNLNSIVNEYRSFAGRKTRYAHEQMIELFDTDLVVIPEHNPEWYEEQRRMQEEDVRNFREFSRKGLLDEDGAMRKRADGGDEKIDGGGAENGDDDGKAVLGQETGEGGLKSADSFAYRTYYYSTQSPLNTVEGAMQPRLQRLK